MVIDDGDSHVPISDITVIVAKKNNLVLISEPIVGNGDVSGPTGDVKQPILATVQRVVVNPHFGGSY